MESEKDQNPEPKRLRTLDVKPNIGEMIKPAELIDIKGHAHLTLFDKRLYNALVSNAFGPAMGQRGQEFQIATADLRGTHKGNERLKDSIERLMKTVVTVLLEDGRTRRVQLLGANDMYDDERPDGILTYSFDPKLVQILKTSTVFGKLEQKVMLAFTSSYALSLYEAIARRYRLKYVYFEKFSLEEFREVMGVLPGKLETWGNLQEKAIKPALREINGLATFGVEIEPIKTGRRITHVRVSWWTKDVSELKDAFAELNRPKIGRRARLERTVEEVSNLSSVSGPQEVKDATRKIPPKGKSS